MSVADDPATHRVVLFGGVNSSDKTWLWDGRQWTSVTPDISPPVRSQAAIAYDPATRLVMLFGGTSPIVGQVVQQFNDTWAWNGITWRRLDSGGPNGPFVGGGGQMAWDAARDEMLLVTSAGMLTNGETWTWHGTRWVREAHGDLAAVVLAGTMAYDPASQTVLLVTPAASNFAHQETFAWNGSSWDVLVADGPQLDGPSHRRPDQWPGCVRLSDVLGNLRGAGTLLGVGDYTLVPAPRLCSEHVGYVGDRRGRG